MRIQVIAAGVLMMLAGAAAAEPKVPADRKPDWKRPPTEDQVMAVFPKEAVQRGLSGKATIICAVSTDGSLSRCVVDKEIPAGMGFGAAAISLTPQFQFTPAIKGGVPVEGSVRFTINFDGPPRRFGSDSTTVLTNPIWKSAPTRADVDAVFPKGVDVEGLAVMDCQFDAEGGLTNCIVGKQQPLRRGFEKAAKALAPKFRGAAHFGDGQSVKGYHVQLPIRFDLPGSPGDGGGVKPAWIALPDPAAVAALFPPQARAAGVKEGKGVIDCRISVGGGLEDCRKAREEPADLGFGDAALVLAPKFHLNPWTSDGRPVDGVRIKLPLVFQDEQAGVAPLTAK